MLAVVITLLYLLSFDSKKCNDWTCNIYQRGGKFPPLPFFSSVVRLVTKLTQDQINRGTNLICVH